jgi:HK97 family phage portal protein
LFNRLKAAFRTERRSEATLADPWAAILLGGAGPTAAGVTVTRETALRCAPVLGAVWVLAETVAALPAHLYRKTPDGGRERADDHPVEALLSDAANPWTPASEFKLVMQTALSLDGNAYAFVNRSGVRVEELIPLPYGTVSVSPDPATMEPVYRVTTPSGARTYGRNDVLHLRGIGTSLYQGDSPVMLAREAIGLSLVLEQHGAGLFGRGARPAGILKYPKALTDDMLKRLRASWDSRYAGGQNAGRTAILEDGTDWVQTQLSSVDAQFLELRKFQLQEIARVWRVPLHLLADLERVTFSNAEQMGAQFLSFTMMPILRAWQDALRMTLLTPEERRAGYYVEFLLDDLARADIAARFTAYSQAINAGVFSPNEIRAMENRGPYAGGETFMRPVNTAPAPSGNSNGGTVNAA